MKKTTPSNVPPKQGEIPLLSFFTGGGFLDMGFEQAGFQVAWSNEFNPALADLHDYAYTKWRRSTDNQAREVKINNRKSINDIHFQEVTDEAFNSRVPALFGVIGGPPCTDFSQGGLNVGAEGINGRLTGVYVERLMKIRPAFFILENVPGLSHHAKHLEYFALKKKDLEKGYYLHERVLHAMDYGVPQDRERLFVVGIRKDIDPKGHAFAWPTAHEKFKEARKLKWPRTNPFGAKLEMPEGLPKELMVHEAFDGARGVEGLPNGDEWFTPYSKKFCRIDEGMVGTKSFKRLHRFRYSPTAWYGNNEVHLHPTQARRISVREALRIQSVPDSYELPKDFQLSAKFKLICNGVPVKLANALAKSVKAHIALITKS